MDVLQAIGCLDLSELRKNRNLCIFEQCEEAGNAPGSGWRARPHMSQDEIEASSLPAGIESGTHRMRFMVCVTGVNMGIWLVSAEARLGDIIHPYVMQEYVSVVLRLCDDGFEVIGKAVYLRPYHPDSPLENDQGYWAMISHQEFDVPTHFAWRKSTPTVDTLEPHHPNSRLPSLETDYSLSLVSSRATGLAIPDEEVESEASAQVPMIRAVPCKTLEVEAEENELELALV